MREFDLAKAVRQILRVGPLDPDEMRRRIPG
jgi:hypothetical protein